MPVFRSSNGKCIYKTKKDAEEAYKGYLASQKEEDEDMEKEEKQNRKEGLTYRELKIKVDKGGSPKSLDKESRSVEVVGATEAPVEIFDWDRLEIVPEVLLMEGCVLPEQRQVPLLDSHQRFGGVGSVLGSYRGMGIEKDRLVGRAHFSKVREADGPFTKVEEGHLTDFSIGYRVTESVWVPARKKMKVSGREFEGPMKVSTKWYPRELSIVAVGADQQAKVRSDHINQSEREEEKNMDPKLREILEKRGLAKEASEEEAWAFLERLQLPKETEPDDGKDKIEKRLEDAEGDEKKINAALEAERRRVREIRSLCIRFDLPADRADALIYDGKTVAEAQQEVLTFVEERDKSREKVGYLGTIRIEREEKDKFRAAAQDSILVRAGIEVKEPAPGYDELLTFGLRDLARECLRMAGERIPRNVMEMVGRAMTTGDFPYILADSARKSLFAGYEGAEETWGVWCGTGSVSDFKTHSMVRAGETDDLDEVPEHGEYNYGERTEAREQYAIVTYGKLFAITRQTIINDDLGALTDVPRNHGEAAARKIGDVAYAVLTANAAMGDGTALFHSNHGNLGTGGAVSETTIAEGIKLMKLQKDIGNKRRLNIRPRYFLGPVAIEGSTMIFFASNLLGTQAKPNQVNPYADPYFTKVYEARLDDNSITAWYLAGPKGKTVTVFFLNGVQTPYMETKQGWTVDGVEYKVRIDAGAKAVDWRALVKNAGS